MLVKVRIQTDIKGKHYIHKKKKVYIQRKCLTLLPKKDEFNIYVNDDGVKYYHIGYRKVYLGNDKDVSKNVCEEMEAVISTKRKKIDKVITDSITEISKARKRKRRRKADKKEAVVRVGQNVISRADRDKEKKAEDAEDFTKTEKKPPRTYRQTTALLNKYNEKAQQVKRDAYEKGLTPSQAVRAVNEFKVLATTPKDDVSTIMANNDFSVLSSMYKLGSGLKYDKMGVPVLTATDEKALSRNVKKAFEEELRVRGLDKTMLRDDDPEPTHLKPPLVEIKIPSSLMTAEPVEAPAPVRKSFNVETGETTDVPFSKEKKTKTFVLPTTFKSLEDIEAEEQAEKEEEGKADPPQSTPIEALRKPVSKAQQNLDKAKLELTQRLYGIQKYIDEVDIKNVGEFTEHIRSLKEPTDVEESGYITGIRTEIQNHRKELIATYKGWAKEQINAYVDSKRENPFGDRTLKYFGTKKSVEAIMKKYHNLSVAKEKAPKQLLSYDELNHEVDLTKNNSEYREKKVEEGIRLEQLQLQKKFGKKGGGAYNQDFYDFASHIIDKYTVGDTSILPTPIWETLHDSSTNNAMKHKALETKIKAKSVISGLEDEDGYWENSIFNEVVLNGIKRDIKMKFPNTQPSLLTDGMFDRAFHGDKMDKAVGTKGITTIKQSASQKNAFKLIWDTETDTDPDTVMTNKPEDIKVHNSHNMVDEEEEEDEGKEEEDD